MEFMRLGILSDTHDQCDRTRWAVQLLHDAGAEALFHCGDFTGSEMLELCAVLPCYFVFGNNDDFSIPDLRHVASETGATCLEWGGAVALDGKQIGITHGHTRSDLQRVLATKPDYLLTGHSHIAADRREGATRWINPGALHRAHDYSVAVLELESDELQFLEVPR
jgi:putative phosphoesterase